MIKYILFPLVLLVTIRGYSQQAITDINPYHKKSLFDNYNPNQIDFSQEYLKLQTKRIIPYAVDIIKDVQKYFLSVDSLFNTGNNDQQNGIIGQEYRRIKIHISKTESSPLGGLNFVVYGKSNVNGNICTFKGNITIIKIYEVTKYNEHKGQGTLFAIYNFQEDASQKHSGIFKGIYECAITIDHDNKTIKFDHSYDGADGYYNRTYVGIWTSYISKISKKCIWGDYRLPFTFDFDCGDGEMHICEKYLKNGWTSFNQADEYIYI